MSNTGLHDDPKSTTPRGLIRYAADFMEAAQATDAKMGEHKGNEASAPVPVMFLTGQAIELALKAFLLSRGVPLKKLRSREYGHQLHVSLKKAKELGLEDIVKLSADEEEVVDLLDAVYATKQLQYIVSGFKIYPVYGPLEKAALRLIHAIGDELGVTAKRLPVAF